MARKCSIADCHSPARTRGWCSRHYTRWRRYGDPEHPVAVIPEARHRVSGVDVASRTGTCATCGPGVALLRSGSGWRCKIGKARSNRSRSRHHGLTRDERSAMLASAGNRCCLCGSDERLRIDHDHATGAVRGVLCHRCNLGLGWFRDDPATLRAAAAYVEAAAAR